MVFMIVPFITKFKKRLRLDQTKGVLFVSNYRRKGSFYLRAIK
jgi:hypothetical protein